MLSVFKSLPALLAVAAVLSVTLIAWQCDRDWHLMRSAAVNPKGHQFPSGSRPQLSPIVTRDFVATLPSSSTQDVLMRFVSREAVAQDLLLVQLQQDSKTSEAMPLSHQTLRVQVTGDYIHIKTLLIDTLSKFPGLVVGRLTMQHRFIPVSQTPSDRSGEEATLELVQYLRPTVPL